MGFPDIPRKIVVHQNSLNVLMCYSDLKWLSDCILYDFCVFACYEGKHPVLKPSPPLEYTCKDVFTVSSLSNKTNQSPTVKDYILCCCTALLYIYIYKKLQ